jgi:uncharacterized membrane protein (DUF106 family)
MKKGIITLMLVMVASLVIASLWDAVPIISRSVHSILDPTLGAILKLDIFLGFLIIIFIITLFITLVQKYATDQGALKQLREDQKQLQNEMKQHKDNPTKMMEIQKKQLEAMPKSFDLTMKPLIYTAIPIILFFRWFADAFKVMGDPKIILGLSWIWFYFIASIVMSLILRKILKVY